MVNNLPHSRIERGDLWVSGSVIVAGILLFFLAGCLPLTGPLLETTEEIPTEIPTVTITPTTVWFPATATYTPFPTPVVTPTVEIQTNVGGIIFKDNFGDGSVWSLAQTDSSSIALGQNELTLAISQPNLYLFTLRNQPVLSDFFLELTASPSLCAGEDEYGVLFRYSSSLDFFRLALTCNGQIHLDRFLKGQASSPVPKTYSGDVPPGAPSSTRIGISASGKTLAFFLNGQIQFSAQDPTIPRGSLGVFTRSAGENAVTISFSDLVVSEVSPP